MGLLDAGLPMDENAKMVGLGMGVLHHSFFRLHAGWWCWLRVVAGTTRRAAKGVDGDTGWDDLQGTHDVLLRRATA